MSERLDQVRALAAQGLSGSEIAKATGSTRNAICGFCRRHNIKLSGVPRTRGFQIVNARGSKFSDRWLEDAPDA